MKNTIKLILATASVALLTACGGGGGGGSTASVPSTATFDLKSAYTTSFITSSSSPFTVTGTVDGANVTGSGTATFGSVSGGTFEGQSLFQKTTTVTGTINGNGQSFPLSSSGVSWTDSNYIPKGSTTANEYVVIIGTATIPTSVRVNDTGTLYTANRFTNSSKTSPLGTILATYVVEADTASTALVTLIQTYRNTSSVTVQTATVQFRINSSNGFVRIKETVVDSVSNLVLTY